MAFPRFLKWVLWIIGSIAGLLVVGAISLFLLLSYLFEPSKDEVSRVSSPSGKFDAVLIETNGGATTSFGYEVYILKHSAKPSGTPPASLYGAVRNESAYGANFRWIDDTELVVEYLTAKSQKVNNSSPSVGGQRVQLMLRAGVSDPSAPSGGMLYNLRGRQ